MNGEAERLEQTLHRIANAILKDSGFAIRYWPKLILTANYLRNREPVVGRDITLFEADTRRPLFWAICDGLDKEGLLNYANRLLVGVIFKIMDVYHDW